MSATFRIPDAICFSESTILKSRRTVRTFHLGVHNPDANSTYPPFVFFCVFVFVFLEIKERRGVHIS